MKNLNSRQVSSIVLLAALALPSAAYAKSTVVPPAPTLRDSVEQTRTELVEKRDDLLRPLQLATRDGEAPANQPTAQTTRTEALIEAYTIRTAGRFNAAVMRLEVLAERLTSRASKLGNLGDTSRATEKISQATTEINSAQAATYRGIDHLQAITTSSAPTYELAQARTELKDATTQLNQARDSLVVALQYLQVVAAGKKTASSSLPLSPSN